MKDSYRIRQTLALFFFLGKQEIRWYCHARMNLFRPILKVLAVVGVIVLTGCQTATPASRISANPVMFRMLSPEQQLMVQQGKICEGMNRDAVYLAWGNPNVPPVKGQQNGKPYEKWVYQAYEPVVVNSVGVGSAFCHALSAYAGTMTTSTAYVPQEIAWVIFENNIVTAWECRK